jgi:hypothetical protein
MHLPCFVVTCCGVSFGVEKNFSVFRTKELTRDQMGKLWRMLATGWKVSTFSHHGSVFCAFS